MLGMTLHLIPEVLDGGRVDPGQPRLQDREVGVKAAVFVTVAVPSSQDGDDGVGHDVEPVQLYQKRYGVYPHAVGNNDGRIGGKGSSETAVLQLQIMRQEA